MGVLWEMAVDHRCYRAADKWSDPGSQNELHWSVQKWPDEQILVA